jgi:hypothetical protein
MAYLKRLRKVTAEDLGRFIEGKSMPTEATPARRSSTAVVVCAHPGAVVFNILDHVGIPRKVGRNFVARCPSCAEGGHDRSGDNLAISIDEPRKYKCWAGCTKEMIRAALGVQSRFDNPPKEEVLVGSFRSSKGTLRVAELRGWRRGSCGGMF